MKNENMLMLGYSEVDITPSHSVEMVGFGREDERSRGILHNLSAQISVWKMNEEICCLVALDHIGFCSQNANFLRTEIGKLLDVSEEKVMLCFSHTHSGPNESKEPEYFQFVCQQIKNGVLLAVQKMIQVSAAWGNAYSDIGLNRRRDCEQLDRRIGVLKVYDANDGKIKLLLLRLTAHGNVLKADNYLISSDYFGMVRNLLQTEYGCPVMATQGASGNVAPKYFKSMINPPDACDDRFIRSDTALMDMAEEIADSIRRILDSVCPKPVNQLAMFSKSITLCSDVPSYNDALDIADDAKKYCGIDGTSWLAEVERLKNAGIQEQSDSTEVQYFVIGNGCLCGVANEVMCEFALRISEYLHDDYFYFGGYTNGCTGYFPIEEEFDKGGYEVYWSMLIYYIYHGRVFPFRRNSASELIRFVVENSMYLKNRIACRSTDDKDN